MTRPRILFDITTLLRTPGQGDGITRTLWNLAHYALKELIEVEFIFLTPKPWSVDRDWLRHHLAGTHLIDISEFHAPGAKQRLRERLPRLKPLLLWVQRPRRQALLLSDRTILRGSRFAGAARQVKQRLATGKYRRLLGRPDGTLRHIVPKELALQPLGSYSADDIVIFAGSEWDGMEQTLQGASQKPRVAALCYDTIPLLFPEFFPAAFVRAFRACVMNVYGKADVTIFSARQIVDDTERLCGQALRKAVIIKLGADTERRADTAVRELPVGLKAGKFALFVSTLEPRKGHRTLFEVWKDLLNENIPQQHDFKLVFVGRKGWMVDDLITDLRAHPSFGTSLLWLDNVDDAMLATLYKACAFTLYPSLYEGFGLPIIESFRCGKAVISSGAGALRETVDGLSPCLDPQDREAWLSTFRAWIKFPAHYQSYEQAIGAHFAPQSWTETARHFFSIIISEFQVDPPRNMTT